jgi:hypothetical protein
VEEAADEIEPALHAAAVGGDAIASPVHESGEVERPANALREAATRKPVERAEEAEILLGGQVLVERDRLRCDADSPADGRARRIGFAVHGHSATVGAEGADNHPDRRRLPGPVRPQEPKGLAPRDGERDRPRR